MLDPELLISNPSPREELELSFVGALWLSKHSAEMVANGEVRPEVLRNSALRSITTKVVELVTDGKPIDGALAQFGGTELPWWQAALEHCPAPSNLRWYWDALCAEENRANALDALVQAHKKIKAGDEQGAMDMLARIESSIHVSGSATVTPSEVSMTTDEDLRGVATGFPCVDSSNRMGGLPSGEVTLVWAPPGYGKTTIMTQMVASVLDPMFTDYYVSLEMPAKGLMRKMMKQLTGFSSCPTRSLELAAAWQETKATMDRAGLVFYDLSRVANGTRIEETIENLLAWVAAQAQKNPPDRIFVDYLQLVSTRSDMPVYERVDYVMRKLRSMAQTYRCPVVVGGQLSESESGTRSYGGNKPQHHAALIIEIEAGKKPEEFKAKIRKNRYGKRMALPWTFDARNERYESTYDPNF